MTYPYSLFDIKNLDFGLKIAQEIKFANIIFINHKSNHNIEAISAPVIIDYENNIPILIGHLWNNNPLGALLDRSEDNKINCKIIFNATDGYISPNVYDEKVKSGKVVPTWNYVSAQFDGEINKTPKADLLATLTKQVSEFESMVNSTWSLADAPEEYLNKLQQVIFGFKFNINTFSVTAKMSQNQSELDLQNIIKWCSRKDERTKDLAAWYQLI